MALIPPNAPQFWPDDEPDRTPKLLVRSLDDVKLRSIDWLWKGWIAVGYLTIVAGESGAGKSTVIADVAARVTTGDPWPGEDEGKRRPPGRVLWLGSEDGMEEMTAPRLTACGANLEYVQEIQGTNRNGVRKTFSMQDDIEAVARFILQSGSDDDPLVSLLVIDPITSYLSGTFLRKVDLNDAGQLRTILEPWLVVANELRIAIVCVTHLAKDTTRSMLHRVLGSSAFVQTCRSLLAVVSRPEEGLYAKALMQVKMNLPEHPGGAWIFSTEKAAVGVDEDNGENICATYPIWHELRSDLTPESVVGGERGPISKFQPLFQVWLAAYFVTRPPEQFVPVSEVKQAAISAGVASSRWWDDHSSDYLEKTNLKGIWLCRRKIDPHKTT